MTPAGVRRRVWLGRRRDSLFLKFCELKKGVANAVSD
jgi:hypothetical protein